MNRTNKIAIRAFNTIFGVSSLVLTGLLMTSSLQAQPPGCPAVINGRILCEPGETTVIGTSSPHCIVSAGSCCQYNRTKYWCDYIQFDGTPGRGGGGYIDNRGGVSPGGQCTNGKCVIPKTDEEELPA